METSLKTNEDFKKSDQFHIWNYLHQKFPWTFYLPIFGMFLRYWFFTRQVYLNLIDLTKAFRLRNYTIFFFQLPFYFSIIAILLIVLWREFNPNLFSFLVNNLRNLQYLIIFSPFLCVNLLTPFWIVLYQAAAKNLYHLKNMQISSLEKEKIYYWVKIENLYEWIKILSNNQSKVISNFFFSQNFQSLYDVPLRVNYQGSYEERLANSNNPWVTLNSPSGTNSFDELFKSFDYWRYCNFIFKILKDFDEKRLVQKLSKFFLVVTLFNSIWWISIIVFFSLGLGNYPLAFELKLTFLILAIIEVILYLVFLVPKAKFLKRKVLEALLNGIDSQV